MRILESWKRTFSHKHQRQFCEGEIKWQTKLSLSPPFLDLSNSNQFSLDETKLGQRVKFVIDWLV